MDYRLITENPEKKFYYPTPHPCCEDMKRNTISAVLSVLEKEINEVNIDENIRKKAIKPLEKMLELSK